MPWIRASLRGQTVFARATASGQLAESAGKVEIRYKANDGRRYDALAKNLTVAEGTVLPDDYCGPAEKPAPKAEGEASPKRGAAGAVKKAAKTSAKKAAAASIPDVPTGSLSIYTDGACTGNPGPAGLGVVVVEEAGRRELSEYLGVGTNNIAELTAIERALDMTAERDDPIRIHTDSQYAIGVLTKGWKAKANRELIEQIREKLADRDRVAIVYVPGHAGVPLNERADELARLAIKTRQTRQEQV